LKAATVAALLSAAGILFQSAGTCWVKKCFRTSSRGAVTLRLMKFNKVKNLGYCSFKIIKTIDDTFPTIFVLSVPVVVTYRCLFQMVLLWLVLVAGPLSCLAIRPRGVRVELATFYNPNQDFSCLGTTPDYICPEFYLKRLILGTGTVPTKF